jgi:hypothetical protein
VDLCQLLILPFYVLVPFRQYYILGRLPLLIPYRLVQLWLCSPQLLRYCLELLVKFIGGLLVLVTLPLQLLYFLRQLLELCYPNRQLSVLVMFLLEVQSQFWVLVEKLDDLLLHRGGLLWMSRIKLLDDPGDLLLFNFLLMLFQLLHRRLYILLPISIRINYMLVFLLQLSQLRL